MKNSRFTYFYLNAAWYVRDTQTLKRVGKFKPTKTGQAKAKKLANKLNKEYADSV